MYAVGRLGSYISRGVYTVSGPFHPFGGAVDIIVVEQEDGSFKSSPWYVRFGKFQGVLKAKEKVVGISVNGVEANFHMYLDHKGEAYFLTEVGAEGESVSYPSSSSDETDRQSTSNRRPMKSKSCKYDASRRNLVNEIDMSNGKILARTTSRRERIFGLVFGRRSMECSFQAREGGAGMERVNSLERAEIAADLLDVKWSTDLACNKPRKETVSRFSASDSKAEKDLEINDGQVEVSLVECNRSEKSLDNHVLDEETVSCNQKKGNSSQSSYENTVCSVDETGEEMSCLSTPEQVIETSTSGGSILEDNFAEISAISRKIDECSVGYADCDGNANGIPSEIIDFDSKIPFPIELEAFPGEQFVTAQVLNEREISLPGCESCDSYEEERRIGRVHSFVYRETSESSIVSLDGFSEQTSEKLYFTGGGHGEVHVHTKTPHSSSESPSETEVLEAVQQETITEQLVEDIEMENKSSEVPDKPLEVPDNHSELTNSSESCILGYNVVDLKEPLMVLETHCQMVSVDPILGSLEEVESQDICSTSNFSNSAHQVQDEKNSREINIMSEFQLSAESVCEPQRFNGDCVAMKQTSIPLSESSEEEQFPFSDTLEFELGEVQQMESVCPDCLNKDPPSVTVKGFEEVNDSINTNYESRSSSNKFVNENPSKEFKSLTEKSRVISNPTSIPISYRIAGDAAGRLVESLPEMRSHLHNKGAQELSPLSHSLDSNSERLGRTLLSKDISRCLQSDADADLLNNRDTQLSGEPKNVLADPAIEISLCRHLLYEGMGTDAASQAFAAEKLDVDKFTSLGPAAVENDRLVVRISDRYFPWDAAAPIILGMVSFGSENIFEPKGMIAVDLVEKTLQGNQSKASVASIGSWGFWPFSFKRSRSRKALLPALNDARSFDTENASESTSGMDGDKNVLKPKVVKKMARAITPTSQQLASLNLKEGRNIITFTFSTAMLGKQQVDARIYLWKWNTRIVISDVDGTITKSDVLGQFMPLVGVDWSQTGVAHLFSAIKENGYQLLFLSARAISQAYHTRQFLVNLKQDGKALPDGPIVISPDGLVPSFYREVIRRAPHEFKITCLEDIKALFPSNCNPFYAGFGNRDTDEFSYLKVGIPKGKIFIINPKGEVAVNRRVDTKSYTSLHALVNGMFPVMTSSEQEDFNSWNYWKLPPPDIDV